MHKQKLKAGLALDVSCSGLPGDLRLHLPGSPDGKVRTS